MAGLKIENVWKAYGDVIALRDINLDIADGEFVVLVGPSGCGKSTLLSIIAGLEEPSAGELIVDGRQVTDASPRDRNIAMVFQTYALYPTMTVRDNIRFGLQTRNETRQKQDRAVADVAELLQITPLLDRRPAQLSGGQRQRVAMGRALVRDPSLFLFDEPLSNLDAKLRVDMRTEIKKLHRSITQTMIYVTHDQVEAMTLADRIVVMKDGRIQQVADPDTIYNAPANAFVAGFMGSPSMNFLDGVFEGGRVRLPQAGGALIDAPGGLGLSDGAPVTVGLRPEHISLSEDARSGIPARVEVIEPTGPETMVVFALEDKELIATFPPDTRPEEGAEVRLEFDRRKLNFFSAETSERLVAATP